MGRVQVERAFCSRPLKGILRLAQDDSDRVQDATPRCHFERAFSPERAEGEKSQKPIIADSISLG